MAVVHLFERRLPHRLTSFFIVAAFVALTAAQNATTTIPPNILGYYQLEDNPACELQTIRTVQTNQLIQLSNRVRLAVRQRPRIHLNRGVRAVL